jgi:hypothetical protein
MYPQAGRTPFRSSLNAIPRRSGSASKLRPLVGNQDPVKPHLGYFLPILLLIATGAAGQMLPEQPAKTFGNTPVSYQAITGKERWNWVITSTVGPVSLAAGLFSAGFGTARNRPREYDPHWEGFGKRYGMRFTGRAAGQSFKGRMRNVVVLTFAARRTDGDLAPAYARYIGISGNNFLSNTWRADSESGVGDACLRTALGFAGRMGSNAFAEFWPSLTKHLFHKKR